MITPSTSPRNQLAGRGFAGISLLRQSLLLCLLLLLLAPRLPAESVSASMPPLPQAATSFGAALAEGFVYVYGGNTGKAHEFNRECVKGDFFRLKLPARDAAPDPAAAWEKLPGGPGLLSSALVAYHGKIIRIGGMNARNEPGAKDDLHSTDEVMCYDPMKRAWEALPKLPEPRSSHDAVVVGDLLYVGGGWTLGDGGQSDQGTWSRTMLVLDLAHPENGWKSLPQPFERRALAAVASGGKLWFIGGMESNDHGPSLAVDAFDLATGQWSKGPELPDGPMKGFGAAACTVDQKVLVSPFSGKLFALSADGGKWELVAALNPARFFHRVLPLQGGRVLVVGGSGRQGHVLAPEIITLDVAAKAAAEAPAAPPRPARTNTSSWPQWRGPNRDGVSPEIGWSKIWPAAGLQALWRKSVGVGMSSCATQGGLVIAQGNDGHGTDSVFVLDAATGAEKWHYSLPCPTAAHEMPIVPNGPGATPTISAGRVYALTREGDLVCLSLAEGELLWRKNLIRDLHGKRPVYGYAQSPLVELGRVFLDVGCAAGASGSTVALDATSGEVVWQSGTGEAGYSSARLFARDGRKLVAMLKGEALEVFAPADGRVLWSYPTTARDFANALTPVFLGHRLLVSNTGEPFARLLDWDLGATPNVRAIWQNQQFAMLFNNPIEKDGCLFAFNEKRRGTPEFTCVDAATGETRWVSGEVPIGTFILADGHWIFLTREGEFVLAPATVEGLKPVARFKAVDGKCYATPALADGRLFVRSNTGDLAAFALPKEEAR